MLEESEVASGGEPKFFRSACTELGRGVSADSEGEVASDTGEA